MLQRLGSLFFGGAEDTPPDPKGPRPHVLEIDEEGWLLISLPDGTTDTGSSEDLLAECPSVSVSRSPSEQVALEESVGSLLSSVRSVRASDPAPSAGRAVPRSGALGRVTQAACGPRSQGRARDKRHNPLTCGRVLCHGLAREQGAARRATRRAGVLHQPCPRTFSH